MIKKWKNVKLEKESYFIKTIKTLAINKGLVWFTAESSIENLLRMSHLKMILIIILLGTL